MSSDSGNTRLPLDRLDRFRETVDAGSLSPVEGYPWEENIGLAHSFGDEIGALNLIIVWGTEVLYGWDAVAAEQQSPRDYSRVEVIDLAKTGWSHTKAKAAALGLRKRAETATPDLEALAGWVIEVQTTEPELLEPVGWDVEDLNTVLDEIEHPELKVGDSGDGDTCPNCGWALD